MWQVVGHEDAVALLSKSIQRDMLSHAYLLVGPSKVGKMTLAMNLSQAVNCLEPPTSRPCGECPQCLRIAAGQHPDVQVIELIENASGTGMRREIGIDQVREMQRAATLKPYEGARRVFIFQEASLLNQESANALLKLLEEPPEGVLLVLVTSEVDSLPTTIVSRCQRIDFNFLPTRLIAQWLQETTKLPANEAESLARLSGGRIGWAIDAVRDPKLSADQTAEMERMASLLDDTLEGRFAYAEEMAGLFARNRDKVLERLHLAVGWWRDMLVLKEGGEDLVCNSASVEALQRHADWMSAEQVVEAVKKTQNTIECLEANINPRLAFEVLMLSLPRREEKPQSRAR